MAARRYELGDAFSVPLKDGGYAIAMVTRMNPSGTLFGYFFGPRFAGVPDSVALFGLRPEDAVLVAKFGHLGITSGAWQQIGQVPNWNQQAWPFPPLVRPERIRGGSFLVTYDDDDPSLELSSEYFPSGMVLDGPEDGLMGAGFVETRLTRLLSTAE